MNILGGLLLTDIIEENVSFNLQMTLFDFGQIHGAQILVPHPSLLPPAFSMADLPQIMARLPENFQVLVHFAGENLGLDLGQTLDEKDIFAQNGQGKTWEEWNRESINLGRAVMASANCSFKFGVLHPGYGKTRLDLVARSNITTTLADLNPVQIVLETIPPYAVKNGHTFWGVGGVPDNMQRMLKALGKPWRCLLDFTHIWVTVNQAQDGLIFLPEPDFAKVIKDYLALPHCNVCHFSGLPTGIVDTHTNLISESRLPVLAAVFSKINTVCLEIPFQTAENSRRSIECFRKLYDRP